MTGGLHYCKSCCYPGREDYGFLGGRLLYSGGIIHSCKMPCSEASQVMAMEQSSYCCTVSTRLKKPSKVCLMEMASKQLVCLLKIAVVSVSQMLLISFTCVRKGPQKDLKLDSSSGFVLGSLDFGYEAVVG